MRYIRNISDDQNKSGDTDNIFRFNLLQGSEIFNFGDYQISINIANSSGYILSMVPEKEFGNSVLKLDFNDQSLKSLTPDNYLLEVEVKFPDGTTATFPTNGGMPFTINGNLKNTAGKLVPTVTFDEVLNAVDKKVNNYLETVVKGDKGDKGDTGVVDTTADYTWTGTNTFTNLINGALKTRLANFTSFATVATNMLKYAGTWYVLGGTITGAPYSGNVFAIIEVIPGSTNTNGIIKFTTFYNGAFFDGLTYVAIVTSAGLGQWIRPTDDSKVLHLTGTETVIGDKTFTGSNIFTQLINGYTKTSVSPNTDVNLITKPGKYELFLASSYTNAPSGMPNNAILIVENILDNGISYQKILSRDPNNSNISMVMFFRAKLSLGWTPWEKVAKDSTVVHNTGTETVVGDKAFTGTTTLNNVVSSNVKNALITALGFTVNFAETALGVNANVVGSGISLLADNTWHILGNMPANITKPKINMYSSMTFSAPAGSTSTNTGFTLRVSFNTTGEIDYKIISLREGDKTNYTVTFDSFLSTTWTK